MLRPQGPVICLASVPIQNMQKQDETNNCFFQWKTRLFDQARKTGPQNKKEVFAAFHLPLIKLMKFRQFSFFLRILT